MQVDRHKPVIAWLLGGPLLAACASLVPLEIREAPPGDPGLEEVLGSTADFVSQRVRWGGVILETENRENTTRVILLARPLHRGGKPQSTDESAGRFIAAVPLFLDPEVYSGDRKMTVTGTVLGSETRDVGDFPYTHPVIRVESHYLWPVEPRPPARYRYPWYYDPWWYDPWIYRGYSYRPDCY